MKECIKKVNIPEVDNTSNPEPVLLSENAVLVQSIFGEIKNDPGDNLGEVLRLININLVKMRDQIKVLEQRLLTLEQRS